VVDYQAICQINPKLVSKQKVVCPPYPAIYLAMGGGDSQV